MWLLLENAGTQAQRLRPLPPAEQGAEQAAPGCHPERRNASHPLECEETEARKGPAARLSLLRVPEAPRRPPPSSPAHPLRSRETHHEQCHPREPALGSALSRSRRRMALGAGRQHPRAPSLAGDQSARRQHVGRSQPPARLPLQAGRSPPTALRPSLQAPVHLRGVGGPAPAQPLPAEVGDPARSSHALELPVPAQEQHPQAREWPPVLASVSSSEGGGAGTDGRLVLRQLTNVSVYLCPQQTLCAPCETTNHEKAECKSKNQYISGQKLSN